VGYGVYDHGGCEIHMQRVSLLGLKLIIVVKVIIETPHRCEAVEEVSEGITVDSAMGGEVTNAELGVRGQRSLVNDP
jgi:hypothetical protein